MKTEKDSKSICNDLIAEFSSISDPNNLEGMKRFGINTSKAFGIKIPRLRAEAKKYKKNHNLAQVLWESGYHELRILACLIDDPMQVTAMQMEQWVLDFNSWDLCDQCCMNLFKKAPNAYEKAIEWTHRKEEFVKRAGFTLMASMALKDIKLSDEAYLSFLECIVAESNDERNFVKKAVNWALRQIGKRNKYLLIISTRYAEEILKVNSKSARWIASDALREFNNPAILKRII